MGTPSTTSQSGADRPGCCMSGEAMRRPRPALCRHGHIPPGVLPEDPVSCVTRKASGSGPRKRAHASVWRRPRAFQGVSGRWQSARDGTVSPPLKPFRGSASQLAVAGRLAPRGRHGRSDREARFTRMRCGKPGCDVSWAFRDVWHRDCLISHPDAGSRALTSCVNVLLGLRRSS